VNNRTSARWHVGTAFFLLVATGGCSKLLPPKDRVIALEGATLIDGAGGEPRRDALIIIRNGHIESVARVNEIPVPKGAEVISLVGKTVIPGLIDAHAHVERWAVGRYLAWGVTTVRDLHGGTDSVLSLRKSLNLGSILGPRMFSAGAMIDGVPTTYANATGIATPEQARRAVDQHAVAGVDYLKIYTKITPNLLRPLLDEAGKLRLPVAAHLGKTDAVTAARAGVVSIEHMAGVVQAATGDPTYSNAHDSFLAGWTVEEKGWAGLDSATISDSMKAWHVRGPKATLAQVADHIEHVRDVAGVDAVGLGSDFDGITEVPVGLEDVSKFPDLIAELLRRGWREQDVKKVAGLNALRVLRAAERVAAGVRLKASR
jgi:hypothetical protein